MHPEVLERCVHIPVLPWRNPPQLEVFEAVPFLLVFLHHNYQCSVIMDAGTFDVSHATRLEVFVDL